MRMQRGFTLIELAVVVGVIGVVLTMLTPLIQGYSTSMKRAYGERQVLVNMSIGKALMAYSASAAGNKQGRLPDPYTAGTLRNTVADLSDEDLVTSLTEAGVESNEINTDGTPGSNVRVYQLVNNLGVDVPLYFQSGPLLHLDFDIAAIYMTECTQTGSNCNPNPATGIPGASSVLTNANYSSWTTTYPDGKPTIISTLPIQKAMLAQTAARLDRIRDALRAYASSQQLAAAPGDTTNWYPTEATSMSGANPTTNQGCRDGWYNLNAATTVILSTIGLDKAEFGSTAWGGRIEYCRDYDPTGAGPANTPPHYGALRINKTPSSGTAGRNPNPSVIGDNIFLSF